MFSRERARTRVRAWPTADSFAARYALFYCIAFLDNNVSLIILINQFWLKGFPSLKNLCKFFSLCSKNAMQSTTGTSAAQKDSATAEARRPAENAVNVAEFTVLALAKNHLEGMMTVQFPTFRLEISNVPRATTISELRQIILEWMKEQGQIVQAHKLIITQTVVQFGKIRKLTRDNLNGVGALAYPWTLGELLPRKENKLVLGFQIEDPETTESRT
jgi:hypothetical protein